MTSEVRIWENNANQRFDRFLRKRFKIYPDVKLTDIFSWIRKWQIKVNGKKTKEDYRVKNWDEISFDEGIEVGKKNPWALTTSKEKKIERFDVKLLKKMIIAEDENWIAWNKPAWIVVHEWNNHWNDLSMNDYLDKYMNFLGEWQEWVAKKLKPNNQTFIPSFGFRLDKDTSWVLISAKNYEALQYINEIIRDRKISKKYLTIVVWKFPKNIKIDKPLEKVFDEKFNKNHVIVSKRWQEAQTECRCEKIISHPVLWDISLVRVQIHTWRMHQIRVHLADAWYPVLWDITYWNPVVNRKLYKNMKINRQLLHCREYWFTDIDNQNFQKFTAPIPEDFNTVMAG